MNDGITVVDEDGAVLTFTQEVADKLRRGILLTDDPRPEDADEVDAPVQTVDTGSALTVSDLSSRAGDYQGQPVAVNNFSTSIASGGGLFKYDGSSSETVDGGTIIGASGVGRWKRVGGTDDLLNVKWFGAVGDGVTDDTTAIRAAIAAGSVYFPPGTYLTGRLNIPDNRTLQGAGWQSILKFKDNQNEPFIINATLTGSGTSNIHIMDLKIDGNYYGGNTSTNSNNRCNCVSFINCHYSSVRRCWIVDGSMDGIYIGVHAVVYPVIPSGTLFVPGVTSHIMIEGNRIDGSIRNGISITKGRDITINNNEFNSNGMGCVDPINLPLIYGAGCIDLEPNETTDACERIIISNNRLYDCKFNGIQLTQEDTIQDIVISGNQVHLDTTINRIGIATSSHGERVAITGNSVYALGGIVCNGTNFVTISGNQCVSPDSAINSRSGVSVLNGAENVTVVGNSIKNFPEGVVVDGTASTVVGVVIVGNCITTRGGTEADSVKIRLCTGLVVGLNLCDGLDEDFNDNMDATGLVATPALSIGKTNPMPKTPPGLPWHIITNHSHGYKDWNPPSVADNAMTSTTVTVTGAELGDEATCSFSLALPAGVLLSAVVTATDTVTVTLLNRSGSTQDIASGRLRASTWRHV